MNDKKDSVKDETMESNETHEDDKENLDSTHALSSSLCTILPERRTHCQKQ